MHVFPGFSKIFQAKIRYSEKGKETLIDNIFSAFIKRATEELKIDWLVSVFKDNSGVIRFD